ncbi:MAG: serine hydrolase domain-containing protein [Anaerolineae bacterium]
MKRTSLVCVLILCSALTALLASASPAPQQSGPRDPAALADAIDRYIEEEMRATRVPGLALGVVYDGKIAYLKGYGVADGSGRAVTPQTPFGLGSISKSFTALAIMQLAEAGALDLDAPVQTYLPAFRMVDADASARVTVRHLLNQVSGISTYAGESAFAADPSTTYDDLIAGVATLEPDGVVGETYHYSNLNYSLLGAIVEAVSGQTFGDYVRAHIYTPLGMPHSHVTYADAQADGMSAGHQSLFGFPRQNDEPFRPASLAAGQLVSSAEDMSRYLLMWLNDGALDGAPVVSVEGVRALQQPASPVTPYVSYAMGWYTNPDATVVWHGGSTFAYHTSMKLLRDSGLGVVVLYNLSDDMVHSVFEQGWVIPDGIISILYGEQPPHAGFVGTGRVYYVLDALALLVVLALVLTVIRLPRWGAEWRAGHRRGAKVIGLAVFHLLLPAAIVLLSFARASLRVILAGVPDFGALLLGIVVALPGLGVAKVVMILAAPRRTAVKAMAS